MHFVSKSLARVLVAAAATVAVVGFASAADYNGPTCACSGTSTSAAVGRVVKTTGNVQIALPASAASPAAAGAVVGVGSTLYTGKDSSASLRFGKNCPVNVPAGSEVTVTRNAGAYCVEVAAIGPGPGVVPVAPVGGVLGALGGGVAPAVAVGVIAGGTAALVANANKKHVSP